MSRFYPASSRPYPHVPGVRHSHITARGLRFHIAEVGEGYPLLLLHGFPSHWYIWHRLLPLLRGFRLICLDLRGFGWSEARAPGWDRDDLVDDVLAVVDELDEPRVGLIEHDGAVGFGAAIRAPERFSGLLSVNAANPFVDRRAARRAAWRYWYTAFLEWPPIGRQVLRHLPAFTRFLIRRGMPSVPREVISEFAEAQREPGAARAGEAVLFEFVRNDILKYRLRRYGDSRLTVPTLMLGGTDDVYVPPSLLSGHSDQADDLQVRTIHGAGHYLPLERPDVVATAAGELFVPVRQ